MTFVDYYRILQVQPDADEIVIKAAANALLKDGKNHPDLSGDADKAKAIIEAKENLLDRSKRDKHNADIRAQLENKIGNYKIIRKIAEGGFGRAYEAKHMVLDEKVCVKHNINISDSDTKLLTKEAKSLWDLRHSALPAMRDFVILADGSCALVMSYIEGPTLFQVIEDLHAKKEEMHPEKACWITARVLDALRYLHFHGVVHGDVKPQNMIIQEDKHAAFLVDFGLASVKPNRDARADGYTPMFAAPESQTDKPPLPETDLYCLGLTMIYALGGNPVARRIPSSTPKPIKDFMNELVVFDVAQRPTWSKVNLLENLKNARLAAFGRAHTEMK